MTGGLDLDWPTRFDEDGYVLLPGCLAANEIARTITGWEEVCRQNLAPGEKMF